MSTFAELPDPDEFRDAVAGTATADRFPESIRIGQIVYRVTRDPDEWNRMEHRTRTSGALGRIEHTPAVLYVNPDSSPANQRLTLLHESLHGLAFSAMGYPTWENLGEDQDDREERVIRMFEAPLLNLLSDNPQLLEYITAGAA